MNQVYRALLVSISLMAAAGCPKPDGGVAAPGSGATAGRLFGVTFQTMNNPFFVDLNQGIEEVVKAHGDRLVTLDAQFNSLKQKNDISDLILRSP